MKRVKIILTIIIGIFLAAGAIWFFSVAMNRSSHVPRQEAPADTGGISGWSSSKESPESDSLRETTKPSESEIIKETVPVSKTVTIAAVGDIMCHDSNLKSAYDSGTGTYDFKSVFEYVKPYISSADIAIANLETVTAGEEAGYSSFPLFNTPDAILEALSYTGYDILSTANNHCLDRRKQGLLRTIQRVREYNMYHTGTSEKADDKRFVTVEANGLKISVLAYTYGCNGNITVLNEEDREYMVNLIDEKKIESDIKKAREEGSDTVIVCMHWGVEYDRLPGNYQEELAKKVFEWGADIILGSHPHVVQRSESINVLGKDRYIIYSMGNFYSNFRREDTAKRSNKVYTEDGVIVLIEIEKKDTAGESGASIKSVKHVPTWVDKYEADGKTVFKIIPIPDSEPSGEFINVRNYEKVKASYNNTMELMN